MLLTEGWQRAENDIRDPVQSHAPISSPAWLRAEPWSRAGGSTHPGPQQRRGQPGIQEGAVALQRASSALHPLQGGAQAEGPAGGEGWASRPAVLGSSTLEGAHEEGDAFLLDQVSQP